MGKIAFTGSHCSSLASARSWQCSCFTFSRRSLCSLLETRSFSSLVLRILGPESRKKKAKKKKVKFVGGKRKKGQHKSPVALLLDEANARVERGS